MKKAFKTTATVLIILLAMLLCACRSENAKKEGSLNDGGYSSADVTGSLAGTDGSDSEIPAQQTVPISSDEDVVAVPDDAIIEMYGNEEKEDVTESTAEKTTAFTSEITKNTEPAATTTAVTTTKAATTTTAATTPTTAATTSPTTSTAESTQPAVTELKAADLSNFPYKTQEPSIVKDYAASKGMVSVKPGEEIVEVDGVQKHRYYFTIENTSEYDLDISYTVNTYVYAGDDRWLWVDYGYDDPMDFNIIDPGRIINVYYYFADDLPEASYKIEGFFWIDADGPGESYYFSFIR